MNRWSRVLPVALLALTGLSLALAVFALLALSAYIHGGLVSEVGGYAPLYLYEPSPYDRIVLEVHYGPSAVPSDAALLNLQGVLQNYTGKTVVLSEYQDILPEEVPASLDAGNITGFGNRVAAEHRVASTGTIGGDAVIYVWYVNATAPEPKLDKGNRVGGVTYRGDSFLIFKNNLRDEAEEKTVLVHEAGHLLGLDHDDNQSCAMVGAFQRVHRANYTAPPPDDYCEEHQRQLADMRHHLPIGELILAQILG